MGKYILIQILGYIHMPQSNLLLCSHQHKLHNTLKMISITRSRIIIL